MNAYAFATYTRPRASETLLWHSPTAVLHVPNHQRGLVTIGLLLVGIFLVCNLLTQSAAWFNVTFFVLLALSFPPAFIWFGPGTKGNLSFGKGVHVSGGRGLFPHLTHADSIYVTNERLVLTQSGSGPTRVGSWQAWELAEVRRVQRVGVGIDLELTSGQSLTLTPTDAVTLAGDCPPGFQEQAAWQPAEWAGFHEALVRAIQPLVG